MRIRKKQFCTLFLIFISAFSGPGIVSVSTAQTPVQKTIQLNTQVGTSPPSITFSWPPIAGATGFQVFRKAKSAVSWGTAIASLPGTAVSFTDTSVVAGGDYEYRIYSSGTVPANTYVWAGIEVPRVDYRGKLILFVDSLFSNSLKPQIDRLVEDITGDGWVVVRYDVSRQSTPPDVKSLITTEYNADPQNVKAVFLLGHVPVPYSGLLNPDGHSDHRGAWPADGYYADLTTNWTDYLVNDTTASRPQNRNVPGDGKFDQNILSSQLELQVGRVDFANLPIFITPEDTLMKRYLDRDHAFRHKGFMAEHRALVDDNFGYFSGEAFAAGAWRSFTTMFDPSYLSAGDYFTGMANDSYLWSYGCGGGSYTSCNGVGSTGSFVSGAPLTVFTMLFGSYFGDWDSQNNFLRAPLASEGLTLTSSWSGRPHTIYHHMALGENIGYSIFRTMRNTSTYEAGYGAGGVHIALMGDPTLRMHPIAPPSSLQASFNALRVDLSWSPSQDSVGGYLVYRKDKATGVYQCISPQGIPGLSFTDNSPGNNTNYYMVRATRLETSNSGTYFNLSQGVFDSVWTNIHVHGMPDEVLSSIRIWPNPAKGNSNIEFCLNRQSSASIRILDMTGRECGVIAEEDLSPGKHVFSFRTDGLLPGTYFCTVRSEGAILVKKLIVF